MIMDCQALFARRLSSVRVAMSQMSEDCDREEALHVLYVCISRKILPGERIKCEMFLKR